ncbi:MAG: ribosome-associated translation inhibitor RaiA [Planctomycetota bacterium]
MQIRVTTRHGHLNESNQEVVTAKAERLNRFFDRLTSIEVVVDIGDPHTTRVDINVSAEHMHEFVSHAESDNLLTAVESAVHRMEQQLRRHKDRLQHRHRDSSAKRAADQEASDQQLAD